MPNVSHRERPVGNEVVAPGYLERILGRADERDGVQHGVDGATKPALAPDGAAGCDDRHNRAYDRRRNSDTPRQSDGPISRNPSGESRRSNHDPYCCKDRS